jgi:hypothetical protein
MVPRHLCSQKIKGVPVVYRAILGFKVAVMTPKCQCISQRFEARGSCWNSGGLRRWFAAVETICRAMQRAPGDFGTGRPAARAISVSWTRDVCAKKMHKRHCRRQIYTRCISGHVHNKTLLAGDRIPNNQKSGATATTHPSLPQKCQVSLSYATVNKNIPQSSRELGYAYVQVRGLRGGGSKTQLVRECKGQIQCAWFIHVHTL